MKIAVLSALLLQQATLLLLSSSGADAAPATIYAPIVRPVNCTYVGCTLVADKDSWNVPVVKTYSWLSCDGMGNNCVKAKGSDNGGMSGQYVVDPSDVNRSVRATVRAYAADGTYKDVLSMNSPVLSLFVDTSGPFLQFVNGLPDASLSTSTSSIFNYVVTTDGTATVKVTVDGVAKTSAFKQAALKGNNPGSVTVSALKPGVHNISITATSSKGSSTVSYKWEVQPVPAPNSCATCKWTPKVSETWDWQLALPINTAGVRDVYDIDGLLNDKSVVAGLKAKSGTDGKPRRVIGYIEAGTLPLWRADGSTFPSSILGRPYDPPYTDERWIDFRQLSQILPLMGKRMDQLVASGFDAIELDNIDGWDIQQYNTGFPLTPEDGLAFNIALSNLARSKGLRVSHKNNFAQVAQNLKYVDFAVSEQCFEYGECDSLVPFIQSGKPVFSVEYKAFDAKDNVCADARGMKFHTMYKKITLDATGVNCDTLQRRRLRLRNEFVDGDEAVL